MESIPSEPQRHDLDETRRRIIVQIRIKEALNYAVTQEEKYKLWEAVQVVNQFVVCKYSESDDGALWRPRAIKCNETCIYYIENKKKFGMTTRGSHRTDEQSDTGNYLMMTREEMEAFVPQHVVDRIEKLNLPGLIPDDDHEYERDTLIRMQLCEAYFAVLYGGSTRNPIGERFMQLPSKWTRLAISSPEFQSASPYLKQKMIDFVSNIPDEGMLFVDTWSTLPSELQDMKPYSEFLQAKLRIRPPKGGFVKNNRSMVASGPKYGGFVDCVDCPRAIQLEKEVVPKLLIAKTNEELLAALESIQGSNYSHYVRPSTEDLAEGAIDILERALLFLPSDHVIVIERCTYSAIEKHFPEWISNNIDMRSVITVLPDRGLVLLRTKVCHHRIIITASFFMMFAENVPHVVRFKCVNQFLTFMRLLVAGGNIDKEVLSRQQDLLCSFLMMLEGLGANRDKLNNDWIKATGDDFDDYAFVEDETFDNNDETPEMEESRSGFRKGRILAMPKGYFKGAGPSTLIVSTKLKIGSNELLFLREMVGSSIITRLLKAVGYLTNMDVSPLEPTWTCPGTRAFLHIEAQPCKATKGTLKARPNFLNSGQFKGDCLCNQCLSKLNDRVARYKRIAEGLPVPDNIRISNKRFCYSRQDREATLFQTDEDALNEKADRQAVHDENQRAQGKKGSQGIHHCKEDIDYPQPFMDLLARATELYIQVQGKEYVFFPTMTTLFSMLIDHENKPGGLLEHFNVKYERGKVRYLILALDRAVEPFLEIHTNAGRDIRSKKRRVIGYDLDDDQAKVVQKAAATIANKTKGGLVQYVFNQLVQERANSTSSVAASLP